MSVVSLLNEFPFSFRGFKKSRFDFEHLKQSAFSLEMVFNASIRPDVFDMKVVSKISGYKKCSVALQRIFLSTHQDNAIFKTLGK